MWHLGESGERRAESGERRAARAESGERRGERREQRGDKGAQRAESRGELRQQREQSGTSSGQPAHLMNTKSVRLIPVTAEVIRAICCPGGALCRNSRWLGPSCWMVPSRKKTVKRTADSTERTVSVCSCEAAAVQGGAECVGQVRADRRARTETARTETARTCAGREGHGRAPDDDRKDKTATAQRFSGATKLSGS